LIYHHIHCIGRFIVVALAVLAPLAAHGQEPFSRIEISGGPTFNVKEGNVTEERIHRFWSPGRGGELSLLTPFYLGDAEAGVSIHRYDAIGSDVPSFDAILVYFGWGFNWELVPGLFWYNGLRIGNNRMSFDEDTFPGIKNESEFLLGGQTRATFHVFRHTGIFASAQMTQTYTFVRFRTLYISAGLTTSLSTPDWLRSFLR
jgi:hypothetical protein